MDKKLLDLDRLGMGKTLRSHFPTNTAYAINNTADVDNAPSVYYYRLRNLHHPHEDSFSIEKIQ